MSFSYTKGVKEDERRRRYEEAKEEIDTRKYSGLQKSLFKWFENQNTFGDKQFNNGFFHYFWFFSILLVPRDHKYKTGISKDSDLTISHKWNKPGFANHQQPILGFKFWIGNKKKKTLRFFKGGIQSSF